MKLFKIFKKNGTTRVCLVSLSLSFIFFLLALFSISTTNYKLANYSGELKQKFDIDTETFLNFDYWFASYYDSYSQSIDLKKTPINKFVIKAANGFVNVQESTTSSVYLDCSFKKNNSIDTKSFIDYKYFGNTKTAVITLNTSLKGIYDSNLYLQIPKNFKGEVVVEGYKENIYFDSSIDNLKINPPTKK